MPPTVSVIICTRNRAASLRLTLKSIAGAVVPHHWNVELLVVDNASTDDTTSVIDASTSGNVQLRYILEPRIGQSRARNRGLAEARGQAILFTDDDVRVPMGWMEAMCKPILSRQADAVAGGVILPADIERMLLATPLSRRRGWFASTEGLDSRNPGRMIGANMAFGRHVLDTVPEFDTNLGPGALGFSDETLFSLRLREAGYRLGSALDVAVEHHFDTSRLTREGILSIAERMGRSDGYVAYHWHRMVVRFCTAKVVQLRAELCSRRLLSVRDAGSYPLEWEIRAVQSLGFHEQYLAESKRPRRYRPLEDSHETAPAPCSQP